MASSERESILEDRVNGDAIRGAGEEAGTLHEDSKEEEEVNHEIPNGNIVVDDGFDNAVRTATELPEDDIVKRVEEAAEPSPAQTEDTLSTPLASEPPSRILRSHSADFDKSSRLSRAFTSAPSQDTSSPTEDESSASTTGGGRRRPGRKKRSISVAPKEPRKSQRKVVIDDFEMMRVLGKGCAGKVLLVRHKATSDLYALKAITKRHVLAHQELQHTLTEQAVLKRMAAEGRDPFVVKLWWSFHDKENLFLVMVCKIRND
jgi:hypothetical protein